jgi:hypothetical protein
MKKTITNIMTACGGLFFCTLIATNYGAVSTFFNLVGNIAKGLGSITLIVLGQGDRIATSGSFRGNIGDDGSGDNQYLDLEQFKESEGK